MKIKWPRRIGWINRKYAFAKLFGFALVICWGQYGGPGQPNVRLEIFKSSTQQTK
jgi:hypothetical protein